MESTTDRDVSVMEIFRPWGEPFVALEGEAAVTA